MAFEKRQLARNVGSTKGKRLEKGSHQASLDMSSHMLMDQESGNPLRKCLVG